MMLLYETKTHGINNLMITYIGKKTQIVTIITEYTTPAPSSGRNRQTRRDGFYSILFNDFGNQGKRCGEKHPLPLSREQFISYRFDGTGAGLMYNM